MDTTIRMARLRAEFAHLYPPIQADTWLPAAELGARILFWHLEYAGQIPLTVRLLDERHFEFSGGWTRGNESDLRTRAADADSVEPKRRPNT